MAFDTICDASQTNPDTGIRTCTTPRDVERGELLVAFEDPGGEGFIQPFQAVGVSAALSAGATQSVGWVTLAFNKRSDPQSGTGQCSDHPRRLSGRPVATGNA